MLVLRLGGTHDLATTEMTAQRYERSSVNNTKKATEQLHDEIWRGDPFALILSVTPGVPETPK